MPLHGIKGSLDVVNMVNILWILKGFLHVGPHPIGSDSGKETEVKKQIDVMMALGQMKPNTLDYACKVTLLMKKDGNH
jgi:hypothetical protein